jgi:hypothetical protein
MVNTALFATRVYVQKIVNLIVRALVRLYPRDGAHRTVWCIKSGINNSVYYLIGNWLSLNDGFFLSNGFAQVVHFKSNVCCETAQVVPRPLHFEAHMSHTISHTHTRYNHSERMISSSQRPLPAQLTTYTRDQHPCPQRNSNPRTQDSRSRRYTPLTVRTLG